MSHIALNPFVNNKLSVKNRVVLAPLSRVSTLGDGVPVPAMQDYYQRFASGQFGMLITEGTYTDRTFAQAYPNQPGITNEQQQAAWADIAHSVKQEGSLIIMQLMHAGALSQHLSNTRAPSSVQPLRNMMEGYSQKSGAYPLPHSLNLQEIDEIVAGFVQSAKRAFEAGFDGIEIHAANGYLLDQFITEYTNHREDQYGGSVINRIRLTTDIIQAIKQAVPESFIVGVRLSQGKVNDFHYKWPGGTEDARIIFLAVTEAGADYIHFASEGEGFEAGCLTESGDSLPALAKDLTGLPVIINGGLDDPEQAYMKLTQGHGDLIALGKGALINPDWPVKVANGRKITPFSFELFSKSVTVNAQFEWEKRQSKSAL